jgi:hypothetical protein
MTGWREPEPRVTLAATRKPIGIRTRQAVLRLLVLHDDDEREFAYTTGAERALEQAAAEGWTVVSMRDEWATVF